MQDRVEISITTHKRRAAMAAIAIIAVVVGWMSVSMLFGNLLAEITPTTEPRANEVARFALRLAPGDPQAHNLFALTHDDQNSTVREMETTVRLSPADFRWRVALGRAYEQAERLDQAERQFLTAVDLAPSYVYPRWHLGNFYLRQGRESEALAELRRATVGHFGFREQVFSLGWDYLDGDADQMEQLVTEDVESRAYLALFLAQRRKGAAALRIWDRLDGSSKERYRAVGSLIIQDLYGTGNYPEAQEIARQLGETNAVPEVVSNASFEDPLLEGSLGRFGWEIVAAEPRADISLDSQNKLSGSKSLKLSFRGLQKEFVDAFQTVIVTPKTNYTLSLFFRTEALRSPVRPVLQVVSANDNVMLGSTEMFPPDSQDWRKVRVSFRTGPNTNAISIRTFRPSCGEQCSLTGVLWYDDFGLSKDQINGI